MENKRAATRAAQFHDSPDYCPRLTPSSLPQACRLELPAEPGRQEEESIALAKLRAYLP